MHLLKHQSSFADYCKTGVYNPIPGVNKKRAEHYRSLVYNVIDDTLQSALPLTFNLLSEEEWNAFVNDFFSRHKCKSTQLWRLPKETHEFVANSNYHLIHKYPFLPELLWLEWLEIELFMMEDTSSSFSTCGNLANDRLVINPEHHLQYFSYMLNYLRHLRMLQPVHT